MGNMTNITILNDGLEVIIKNPQEFVDQICIHMNNVRNGNVSEFGIGYFANGFTVNSNEHADVTTILAVGGNYTTVLGSFYNRGIHHTEESQVDMIKKMADKLGYRLVKKTLK